MCLVQYINENSKSTFVNNRKVLKSKDTCFPIA